MTYEQTARNNHKNGMNCAMAVYTALGGEKSNAPKPRAEGGKCGVVLAAEQIILAAMVCVTMGPQNDINIRKPACSFKYVMHDIIRHFAEGQDPF